MDNEKILLDDVKQVIGICNQLLSLVDLGEAHKVDDDRFVFYGVVRDTAFKLRRLAKNELLRSEQGCPDSSEV